ncbi:hypothetical protein CERSUDRAFT_95587 [Gelatoporia subvermispora B]|uniref:Uncharacterized protein n=1 Tax=Ceriporiopsis subvermispora (strain B) TaxID=914234 RepID=M2QGR9_CERS8|nr:hypothetical protein CERSUDRAFT_95587 [Gelatoporia subvermispora B]
MGGMREAGHHASCIMLGLGLIAKAVGAEHTHHVERADLLQARRGGGRVLMAGAAMRPAFLRASRGLAWPVLRMAHTLLPVPDEKPQGANARSQRVIFSSPRHRIPPEHGLLDF